MKSLKLARLDHEVTVPARVLPPPPRPAAQGLPSTTATATGVGGGLVVAGDQSLYPSTNAVNRRSGLGKFSAAPSAFVWPRLRKGGSIVSMSIRFANLSYRSLSMSAKNWSAVGCVSPAALTTMAQHWVDRRFLVE